MNIEIVHTKNAAAGWDISARARSENTEKISRATINLNGFDEYDETFSPPLASWQNDLRQRGQFPGKNRVRVSVTDDNGNETSNEDVWD